VAGIFSRFIFNNAIFNTDGGSSDAGMGAGDYREYRRRLEELSKINHERERAKYIKKAEKVLRVAKKIKIEQPTVIKEAIYQAKINLDNIDFSALQKEVDRLLFTINQIIKAEELKAQQLIEQELDDELALLLLI
jgi:hypothetical protein